MRKALIGMFFLSAVAAVCVVSPPARRASAQVGGPPPGTLPGVEWSEGFPVDDKHVPGGGVACGRVWCEVTVYHGTAAGKDGKMYAIYDIDQVNFVARHVHNQWNLELQPALTVGTKGMGVGPGGLVTGFKYGCRFEQLCGDELYHVTAYAHLVRKSYPGDDNAPDLSGHTQTVAFGEWEAAVTEAYQAPGPEKVLSGTTAWGNNYPAWSAADGGVNCLVTVEDDLTIQPPGVYTPTDPQQPPGAFQAFVRVHRPDNHFAAAKLMAFPLDQNWTWKKTLLMPSDLSPGAVAGVWVQVDLVTPYWAKSQGAAEPHKPLSFMLIPGSDRFCEYPPQ